MLEKFHYQSRAGEIVVPKFRDLPIGFARKMRKADTAEEQFDVTFSMIESVMSDESLEVFDQLSMSEFADFQEAWQKDSSAGELSGSSENGITSETP